MAGPIWEVARKGPVVFDMNVLLTSFRAWAGGDVEDIVALSHPRGRRISPTTLFEFLRRSTGESLPAAEVVRRRGWLEEQRIRVIPWHEDSSAALTRIAEDGGLTVKLADAHIAAACIGVALPLLTRDRDFDVLARHGLLIVDLPHRVRP